MGHIQMHRSIHPTDLFHHLINSKCDLLGHTFGFSPRQTVETLFILLILVFPALPTVPDTQQHLKNRLHAVYNSQDMEAPSMSINRGMDKKDVHLHHGISLSH